ncbi:UNVERIFIED_CONTAM: hypothetical protein Sradi_4163900 [Sesamum radiatum]|uniref:Uncharacterized protein n=1 Tax=Sesamum radiatum TaxID=300843 RepID=A0AAW2P234_SESRA
MAKLGEKLKRLKHKLKIWNKTVFCDIFSNLKVVEETVAQAERNLDAMPIDEHLIKMNRCTATLQHAISIEEDFWRQKASCKWILEGERNTQYFHSVVRKTRARTMINYVVHDGRTLSDVQLIKDSGVEFFCSLLTANRSPLSLLLLQNVPRLVSPKQGEALYQPRNADEVRTIVFGLFPDSTAEPYGFGVLFFKKCWDIIQSSGRFSIGVSFTFKLYSYVYCPHSKSEELDTME